MLPETATGLLDARLTAVPPTFTVKALDPGSEAVSSASPKINVSADPFTIAEDSTGAVSTLWPDCAVFAAWVSAASTRLATILVMNLIVPPLSASASAAQEIPSASLSPAATV